MSTFHKPVLLKEVIANLNIKKDEYYLDCTFGAGGHSKEILKNGGKVIAIDRDAENEKFALELAKVYPGKILFFNKKFSEIENIINEFKPHGILYDFGVSSMQLDSVERGFSFSKEAKLDMNMGLSETNAFSIINRYREEELADIIYYYSDEKEARKIARLIVAERKKTPIETTTQLATLIEKIFPSNFKLKYKIHPATRTFQAIRIAVNNEFEEIKLSLQACIKYAFNCYICCISFHSIEDRIVKNIFSSKEFNQNNKVITNITKKPIEASEQEIEENIRSRSAKLRVYYIK